MSLSLKDLLDKRRTSNASFQLGTLPTVNALKVMLHRALAGGHRKSDKELRNTVLIIATLLARRKENRIMFLEAGCVGRGGRREVLRALSLCSALSGHDPFASSRT